MLKRLVFSRALVRVHDTCLPIVSAASPTPLHTNAFRVVSSVELKDSAANINASHDLIVEHDTEQKHTECSMILGRVKRTMDWNEMTMTSPDKNAKRRQWMEQISLACAEDEATSCIEGLIDLEWRGGGASHPQCDIPRF